MCSVYLKKKANKQLKSKELRGESKMIRTRLSQVAGEADTNTPGLLDAPACHMARWSTVEELKEVRKYQIGDHRIYFTGNHHACRYDIVHIKAFKKYGTDDDDSKDFQKRLINILSDGTKDSIEIAPIEKK